MGRHGSFRKKMTKKKAVCEGREFVELGSGANYSHVLSVSATLLACCGTLIRHFIRYTHTCNAIQLDCVGKVLLLSVYY